MPFQPTTVSLTGMDGGDASQAAGCAAPQPAAGGFHLVEWGCELLGTALFVLFGLGAVALHFSAGSPVARLIPSVSQRFLLTGALFTGAASVIAVSPLGRRSGGHLNPAVTLAFWLTRRVHRHDLAGYVGAQLLGGVVGAAVFRLLGGAAAAEIGYGVTRPGPGVSGPTAAGIEAALTAGLVLVIFAFLSSPRSARWTPVAAWACATVLIWRVGPHTAVSLDPARSLGPAVVAANAAHQWVYLAGPLSGALLAAAAWCLVPARLVTAKLFHDARYPSVLACDLPAMPVSAGGGGITRVKPDTA